MKHIRIAAGLTLSAALMIIPFGVQAAASAEPVAFLADTVCEDLVEVLEANGIADHDGDAVVDLEMTGPVHPFRPMSAWLHLDPPTVTFFRCDRPVPGALSSDIATAN